MAAGSEKAANCNDCHGNHDIYPARDERSRVNHWKVPGTCGQCHQEIAREFNESVHGAAVKAGVRDAPVCIDCHGEHLIVDPRSLASPLSAASWHFYLVIFDPMVYPMDTAWLDGKISADHYRHTRPAYYRELRRAGLLETPGESEESDTYPEPVQGDD